ncbi:MAG: intradiol ring-cleavage dioxygenase [Rhodospirillales bacterium]
MSESSISISRRGWLRSLALGPVAAAVAAPLRAAEPAGNGLIGRDICLVTPRLTEGPFYIDPKAIRSDITEGKPGVPVRLALQVVSAATGCTPIANARVDLWQCDAEGNYSGFARQGSDAVINTRDQTFLRGSQFTGDDGVCSFRTIYPGWYAGRTTHFHYKVFLDARTVLASQIFLPDALNAHVYEAFSPYNTRGATQTTFNYNDFIARQGGDAAYASIEEAADGYAAALVVGLDRTG